jgi:hypothetical protein
MATIIDSFVVELGLDPSKLSEGATKSISELRKLENESKKHTGGVQKHFNELSETLTSVQGKLLGLAAIFLGGMGLTQFAEHITQITTQLGRMGQQAGVSARDLAAWGAAGATLGANPANVQSAVAGFSSALYNNKITVNSQLIASLAAMGIHLSYGPDGKFDTNGMLLQMSRYATAPGRNPADAAALLGRVPGMNSDMISLLLQGPDKLKAKLGEMAKLGPTDAQVKAANELTNAWGHLTAKMDRLGRVILERIAPGLEKFIGYLDKIADFFGRDPEAARKDPNHLSGDTYTDIQKGVQYLKDWWNNRGSSTRGSASGGSTSSGPTAAPSGGGTTSPGQRIEGKFDAGKAEVQADIANQFRAAGADDKGVAAIFANVQRESGFKPWLRHFDQPRFRGTEAENAHGLYQEGGAEWNHYAAWLAQNYPGRDWKDPRLQTQFLIQNLKKNYPRVWRALTDPNLSAGQKAMAFQQGYLRPAVPHFGDVGAAESFLRRLPSIAPNSPVRTGDVNNSARSVTTTTETNIGEVHVHAPSNDPYALGTSVRGVLANTPDVAQSNTGPE